MTTPSPFESLGVSVPVLAAPMAGGATTPAMVRAAASVGSLGFLAGGYKSAEALAAEIAALDGVSAFGVNLFAPNMIHVEAGAYRDYRDALTPVSQQYGIDVTGIEPTEDDDGWSDKIDLLLADPVPVVGFTFGLPDASVIAALRRAGTVVVQTVTTAAEARAAADRGVDLLVVQATAGGGHSGTWTPHDPPADVPLPDLVRQVRAATTVPVLAAGGVATRRDVEAARAAGVGAVVVGTALLRSAESGASAPHKAALAGPARTTVVTRAFTGRPARALRNAFTDEYSARAPLGYPALHHLTGPIRKAAARAGNVEHLHLWAGTGFAYGTEESTAAILTDLAT